MDALELLADGAAGTRLSPLRQLRIGAAVLVVFSVATGILYPLAVTAAAQVFWPTQANGSTVVVGGRLVGSRLIGQPFTDAAYFWSRPSATAPYPYNAAASAGSNLGPSSSVLSAAVDARVRALRDADPTAGAQVPVDLVTASGSGLDPHISPAAAFYQIGRVARARDRSPSELRDLVAQHTEGRQLWILGEPRVNVLALNLALDGLQ